MLFVSHNMNAVESLCSGALLLEKGRVNDRRGDVRSVINSYLSVRAEIRTARG